MRLLTLPDPPKDPPPPKRKKERKNERKEKQEISLKKIIVEDVTELRVLQMKAFSLRTFCSCCCSLLISVSGKTY